MEHYVERKDVIHKIKNNLKEFQLKFLIGKI